MKHVDIAIIGAGIAGLSAAVACHQKTIDAQVFEAAPDFKPLGTSLSLWPNAMQCLQDWGLDQAVASSGEIIEQIAWRRFDGKPYFTQPLNGLYEKLGSKGYCVRRADLHAALVSATPQECIHLGCNLAEATEAKDCITLKFDNGTLIRTNHVIGADGLWSPLRQKLLRDPGPTSTWVDPRPEASENEDPG